jgi:hypothetical protein
MTFAGKRVRGARGVGLALKVPRRVGRGKRFGVVVKDQFGQPASGVTVTAGGAVRATDARGRASLKAPRRGSAVKVVATATGFRKATTSVRLR